MSQLQALLHEEERISTDRNYDYPSVHEHLRKQEAVDWVARKATPGKALGATTKVVQQNNRTDSCHRRTSVQDLEGSVWLYQNQVRRALLMSPA